MKRSIQFLLLVFLCFGGPHGNAQTMSATTSSTALSSIRTPYTIVMNDTLFLIALRHSIPLSKLIAANPTLLQPDQLQPGQVIWIPQKPTSYIAGTFPLPRGTYTYQNDYGQTRTFGDQASRFHEGVDLFAPLETPIVAVAPGIVWNVGWSTLGGWRLTVKTDHNHIMYYAHLSRYERAFTIGDRIIQGQRIGYVGHSGYGPVGTTGRFPPHLHFGMYTINPWAPQSPYVHLAWWELRHP